MAPLLAALALALLLGSPAAPEEGAPQRRYMSVYANELVETWAKHGSRSAGLQNFSVSTQSSPSPHHNLISRGIFERSQGHF